MATITPTVEYLHKDRIKVYTWTGLTTNDIGDKVDVSLWNIKSVHSYGTFGGATLAVQESNEITSPTNWATRQSITGAGLVAETVEAVWLRLSVTGGAGVSITVKVYLAGFLG
jgi:hypothetical protein